MILPRINKKAKSGGLLLTTALSGLCCGDRTCALLRKYRVKLDTTTVTSISKISLGGIVIDFAVPVNITHEAGRNLLISEIHNAISEQGYEPNGVRHTMDGDILCLDAYFSDLVFDWIEAPGNPWTVTDAVAYGNMLNCDCDDCEVISEKKDATSFSGIVEYGADGDVVEIKDADGNVVASFTSNGTADGTEFELGGPAQAALDMAGLNWTFDKATKEIVIHSDTVAFGEISNTTSGVNVDLAGTNASVCLKVVSCKTVGNVKIENGGTVLYDGPVSQTAECITQGNAQSQNGLICIDLGGAGITLPSTFDVTINEGTDSEKTTSTEIS